ncbi:YtxH domain-containing protein [Enterococcus sp.]|uniref:YtxH domain-containing protein n=1 Tax=Enterococcus sp. TaxID=35783 RepID=UPI002FC6388E
MAKGFFKGLLFGGLVGGFGGLLFAPQKGEKTRNEMAEPIRLMSDDIQTVQKDYQTVIEKADELQHLTEALIPDFQKSMEKSVRAFEFQAEPRIARINEQLNVIQSHLAGFSKEKPSK